MSKSTKKEVKGSPKEAEGRKEAEAVKVITDKVREAFRLHKLGINNESLGFKNSADRTALIPMKPKTFKTLPEAKQEAFKEAIKARECSKCYSGLSGYWNYISCNMASPEGLPVKCSETNLKGLKQEVKPFDKVCKFGKIRQEIETLHGIVSLPAYFGRALIGEIITEAEALEVINYKLEASNFKPIKKIGDKVEV